MDIHLFGNNRFSSSILVIWITSSSCRGFKCFFNCELTSLHSEFRGLSWLWMQSLALIVTSADFSVEISKWKPTNSYNCFNRSWAYRLWLSHYNPSFIHVTDNLIHHLNFVIQHTGLNDQVWLRIHLSELVELVKPISHDGWQ